MMATPVTFYPLNASEVVQGGSPVTAIYGPVDGGVIFNPITAADQGIPVVEVLYVNVVSAASPFETITTIPIQPGSYFQVLPSQTTNVSVTAATSGHKFSGFYFQPQTSFPPAPQSGVFPPSGPPITQTIPSFLYEEYQDDPDLQAFVASYNILAQQYVTWFAFIGLPVYTSPNISGLLLDWVAQGLYGMTRPSLSSGQNRNIGPYNTWAFNTIAYNKIRPVGPQNVTVTTDDIFKRIMTWNFYKGDGNTFNIKWLKRRIMRFLLGTNGSAPNIDQTYIVSVTFGPGIISIRITGGTRTLTGGALYNRFGYNSGIAYNAIRSKFNSGPNPIPYESVLQECIESGVLQLPFQYQVVVSI